MSSIEGSCADGPEAGASLDAVARAEASGFWDCRVAVCRAGLVCESSLIVPACVAVSRRAGMEREVRPRTGLPSAQVRVAGHAGPRPIAPGVCGDV
jgi:hypothetical protein